MVQLPENIVLLPRVSARRVKLASPVMHEMYTFWSTCKQEDISKEVLQERGLSDIEWLQNRVLDLMDENKRLRQGNN